MAHKSSKSKTNDVSLQKVDLLKSKIQNPQYLNDAIRWIASNLAQKIRSQQQ